MSKELKEKWVDNFQNEFMPFIDFEIRNEVIEFIDNLLKVREKEILERIRLRKKKPPENPPWVIDDGTKEIFNAGFKKGYNQAVADLEKLKQFRI